MLDTCGGHKSRSGRASPLSLVQNKVMSQAYHLPSSFDSVNERSFMTSDRKCLRVSFFGGGSVARVSAASSSAPFRLHLHYVSTGVEAVPAAMDEKFCRRSRRKPRFILYHTYLTVEFSQSQREVIFFPFSGVLLSERLSLMRKRSRRAA